MTLTRGRRGDSTMLVGLLLMLFALMGAAVGVQPALGDALGDDEGVEDDPAPSQDAVDAEEVEVTETAVYTHPLTDSLPPTLTDSVPPQAVCVVEPSLCPEELSPVTGGLEDAIATIQDEAPVSPVQPVAPETLAVGYVGGHDRYESAMRFELPDVPEGEEVTSFQLYLPVAEPTYDMSSPAFRDVVTSIFLTISDQDPVAFGERLAEALQNDPIDADNDFLRMEACALTQPFEPSEAPETQHRDDMPRDEPFEEGGLGEPAVDCMLGGTGTLDEEGEHWVFDLTFAVDAWTSGEIDNHGVLISPAGVPNLAFGDPDTTTWAQMGLDHTQATAEVASEEPPPPLEALDDEPMLEDEPAQQPADTPDTGGELGPAPDASGPDAGADQPEVAEDPGMSDEPAASEPVQEGPAVASPETQQATPASSANPSPWTWLLVPVFAGGAWLVTRSLTAPVTAAAAGGSGGAMSRLIASRGGPTPA